MNKILNCFSTLLLALTLFSCNKNEWTPKIETEFRKNSVETMLKKGNGLITPEQANFTMNCAVEKLKAKNILPYDSEKPENASLLLTIMTECTEEWMKKNNITQTLSNEWTPEIEKANKELFKIDFMANGFTKEQSERMADCIIDKLKVQKISPAGMEKAENAQKIEQIGFTCGQEILKK